MQPVKVLVSGSDPITRAGVSALLAASRDVTVLADAEWAKAEVVVLAEDVVAGAQLDRVRQLRASSARKHRTKSVLVTDRFNENDLMFAVQCGVVSILPKKYAAGAELLSTVLGAATGAARLPRPLQAAFLRQTTALREEVLHPHGLTLSGLLMREIDVIRLLAEGFRTDEIASKLQFSEGTIRTTLYGAIKRLGLVNRPHAISYAIRTGALAP
ncbi:response regulator transcription factor [Amycolatopsis sp. lyj-109]|uniref:helix-turn-helix transcriptional regulator n=1 Tax=Amycolatopsis sp. lyj-109 TaxID=2789287 RepID=UPI003978AA2A